MRAITRWAHAGLIVIVAMTSLVTPGRTSAQQDADFAARVDLLADNPHPDVTLGDLNGDGVPDLVVTNASAGSVTVLITQPGAADATTMFSARQAFPVGSVPRSIAIGDLNGDKIPDLAVVNEGSDSVSVLISRTALGAATPSFTAHQEFQVGDAPKTVAIGDLNGDGKNDLVVSNGGSASVSVLLNQAVQNAASSGFAAQKQFTVGTGPRGVAIADMNGDGRPDVVTANLEDDSVSVLRNLTQPGAAEPSLASAITVTSGNGSRSLALADMNGDGTPDVTVANEGDDSVSVLLNTTQPGGASIVLRLETQRGVGRAPSRVAVGDLNHDGKADIVVSNRTGNSVSFYLNTTGDSAAALTFGPIRNLATGAEPVSVALGDLNRDGRDDIVVSTIGSRDVGLFVSKGSPATAVPPPIVLTPGQRVGQEHVPARQWATPAFLDPVTLVTVTGATRLAVGDIDQDGRPDLATISLEPDAFLAHFNQSTVGGEAPRFGNLAAPWNGGLQSVATRENPTDLAIADMNGDTLPEIVVVNRTMGSVSFFSPFEVEGQIQFTSVVAPIGGKPGVVLLGAFAGDGNLDVVIGYGDGVIGVLESRPSASGFRLSPIYHMVLYEEPRAMVSEDLNRDGMLDIAAVTSAGTLVLLINNGQGGRAFTATQVQRPGREPSGMAVGDLNADGMLDYVVTSQGSRDVDVYFSPFDPSAPPFTYQAIGSPSAVAIGEITGDGLPDIVIASDANGGIVEVHRNMTQAGASRLGVDLFAFGPVTGNVSDLVIADVNFDEKPDIAVVNGGAFITIFTNSTTAP